MFNSIIEKKMLKQLEDIKYGSIKLTTPEGKTYEYSGSEPGYNADITIHDWKVAVGLSQKGDVGFAEDYRDGNWETNDLAALLTFGLENEHAVSNRGNWLFKQMSKALYIFRKNSMKGSKKNISAHYDLGNDFYELWLDPTMTYSSALYKSPDDSIETAQHNKYDRIIDRLGSNSGNIIEIGCGWGGFAERAMQQGDYGYKGITLSTEQHDYAQQRLNNNNANFVIEDYRIQKDKFDHIVSIEMFEAVGEKYWKTYFDKVKGLLADKGKAVIQTITIADDMFETYRKSADMIRTYIFPGGMLPSKSILNELTKNAELKCQDMFAFGQDYAKTLNTWLNKFNQNIRPIKQLGYDDGFIRLWQFYLAGCVATFRTSRTDVVQLELSHA